MSFLARLRIFKRLRDIETLWRDHAARLNVIEGAEIGKRLDTLETESKMEGVCACCGAVVNLLSRENGPVLMHQGERRLISCNYCVPIVKRGGWRPVKIAPASKTEAPPVIEQKQEAAS